MDALPLIALSPLMLIMIWTDLRYMRIPNRLVLAALALFTGLALFGLVGDLDRRLITAAVVLTIGFGMFAAQVLGGGDVKALAVLMLFVPPRAVPEFMILLSLAMLGGLVLVYGARRLVATPDTGWASLRETRRFPLGLSIGSAALALPALL